MDALAWESEAEPVVSRPAATEAATNAVAGPGVTVELAGEASYVTPPIRGGATPFGAGFGARAGLEVSGLYVGLRILDFLGGRDVDVSYRAMLYGLDVGYGIHVPTFGQSVWLVRPRVGVGDAAVAYTDPSLAADVVTTASGTASASDTITVNNVFVEPGLTIELVSGSYFIALDGSLLVLPGIAYGGADKTTWLMEGLRMDLGLRF